MSKQTIEIKGRQYNAVTGEIVIGDVTPPRATAGSSKAPKHTPKPSQTLMRSAVTKPSAHISVVQAELTKEIDRPVVKRKSSIAAVDPARRAHAKETPTHRAVSRFHVPKPSVSLAASYEPTPVQPEPRALVAAAEPAAAQDTAQLFMRAIASSNHHVDIKAHTAKHRARARHHYANMSLGAASLLLIALFGWYLNSPGLQIRVAGLQAGVSTVTPQFSRTGFAFAGVTAQNDRRIIHLTADNATYQLTERATSWNGSTMIQNVSSINADGSATYTTVETSSGTIYKLSDTQATWVKNGTWYQLHGTKQIDDSKLRSLANNS